MRDTPRQKYRTDASIEDLPGPEVDRLIRRCAAALRSHASDFAGGADKENALVAFESTLAVLLEVRDLYRDRQADIDAILHQYGYPLREN